MNKEKKRASKKPKRPVVKVGHIYACAFNYLGARYDVDHSVCGLYHYRVDLLMHRSHWVALEPLFVRERTFRCCIGVDLDAFRFALERGEMKRVGFG